MSSFIGHGLTALAIGKIFESKTKFKHKFVWMSALVLCAFFPDIDYAVSGLDFVHNHGLRITHSIAFSLILPFVLTVLLFFFDRKNAFWGGVQLALAGLSHLLLDTLVGSRQADPILFPIMDGRYKLPFGILPSAARLSFSNYYFYRNALIESGILLSFFILIFMILGKIKSNKFLAFASIIFLFGFLFWSVNLKR